MKIASFEKDGKSSYGVVTDDGIIDMGPRIGAEYPALIDILKADAFAKVSAAAEGQAADFGLDEVTLQSPVPFPEKIICIGVNYGNRNEEYKDGSDAPKNPSVFLRTPGSFVGHNEDILRPPESDQLDYEGEIVLVIGKAGRRIPEANFADHIAGLSIMNEGTIRDWVRHAKFNVTQGKNFGSSGSIGPWMVTADEFDNYDNLAVQTRVNGEVRQDDVIDNMIFKIPFLLNYLSTFMELKPGDLIATGTPVGAGARFDPPIWLKPGDVLEIEVPSVGVLRNTFADEQV
ncbi:MAG: fumarylacetoacetate hydrolase family protein [Rhodospirillaceae bacterium]|jgi:2-keto-4-pentenoate hydratase/2-oxohepta-3-ene-1,7-dioic acid hydratase in catechol pathway|nr:fumarylacetoacetate hydrolase family protein [Rhodospirillaceae bacterium]MBT7957002.1 fumarylacetoacetate hydrolase family protein [Rhodospirillaceae bacterium]